MAVRFTGPPYNPRASLGAVVLPAEGHVALIHDHETAVGDHHTVRVARQVHQYHVRPGERALGVDQPFLPARRRQLIPEGLGSCRPACSPKNCSRPARWSSCSPSRKRRRNRRESTRTGRKKPGRQPTQRPSASRPPPGTMPCTCGWCVSAEPQVCRTSVTPMRAPRCLASAAMVSRVSAAASNSSPYSAALLVYAMSTTPAGSVKTTW